MREKEKIINKLQIELLEKDKPLKEKVALIHKMEEKLAVIEKKHEKELDELKQELLGYQQNEIQ